MPGEFHGQRSLAGYSPWGWKESDTTETTNTFTLGVWALETDQGQMQDLSLIKRVSVNTITSPYSHWIGSCLAFWPHLPLHILSGSNHSSSSSPPGITGAHTVKDCWQKGLLGPGICLSFRAQLKYYFLGKSFTDNPMDSNLWHEVFYSIYVFISFKALIPIWNCPTYRLACLLPVFPN